MPRYIDRILTHLETWTFYEPLVTGTHLFDACHAGGAQEIWSFLGDDGAVFFNFVFDSHLFGVSQWSTRIMDFSGK